MSEINHSYVINCYCSRYCIQHINVYLG